jgi:DNA helicase-2/ATP-dependent DNA helicase PcrA
MPRVDPLIWTPRGVESLEPTADTVVRSAENTLVVAGPGAGKTELLAQRACFLLETGACPPPHRILAISFKRDAAKNLDARVARRCGDQARRFDSMTLDAFGKSLIDRFRAALPVAWRPPLGYEVLTTFPRTSEMRDWFLSVPGPSDSAAPNFRAMEDSRIRLNYERCQFGCRLPYDDEGVSVLLRHYALTFWREALAKPAGTPSLSFPMLNRLAAFLLRNNPKLLLALRSTYSHVFMDEFQDTTESQYDLVQAGFQSSNAALTAVGDSKQRIMTWAGAMEDAFERFETDFVATRCNLVRNYRSAPELVRIQDFIAQSIESDTPPAEPVKSTDGTATCSVLEFATPEEEAKYIANMVESGIASEGLTPRSFCILARQRTASIITALQRELATRGIRLRDESTLQDLLSEPITELLLSLLRLATRSRDPSAWEFLTEELDRLHGTDRTAADNGTAVEAARLLAWTKDTLASSQLDRAKLPADLIQQIGEPALRVCYRQYRAGNFLNDITATLGAILNADPAQKMPAVVSELIGEDIVPAMTVHKSKGLEFHTVVFLGLEDSQLWNFANQSEEEVRGFFVAFSRAIHRVVFTFSDVRDGRRGREQQGRTRIRDLYSLLQAAGVPTINCRGE